MPTSASSSFTTRATPPPAATARSLSSRGPIESGVVEAVEPETRSPSTAPRDDWRRWRGSRTATSRQSASATCPAYVHARGLEAAGRTVDVAFGGAFYAFLEERVAPGEVPRLIELGRADQGRPRAGARDRPSGGARAARRLRRRLLAARRRRSAARCSETSRCSPTARSIARRAAAPRLRVWRCSTCQSCAISASSARSSAPGSSTGRRWADRPAVITEVEGSAHRTGTHEFVLEPGDDLGTGFLLR